MEKEDVQRSREGLLLTSASHGLTDKSTKGHWAGGRNRKVTEESRRRTVLPGFALSTLIMDPVVNLVVMATSDHGQLWVHHIRFLGIILPCVTMRITDAVEKPGGCMADLMDQSIPETVLEEGWKEIMST